MLIAAAVGTLVSDLWIVDQGPNVAVVVRALGCYLVSPCSSSGWGVGSDKLI